MTFFLRCKFVFGTLFLNRNPSSVHCQGLLYTKRGKIIHLKIERHRQVHNTLHTDNNKRQTEPNIKTEYLQFPIENHCTESIVTVSVADTVRMLP